MSFDFQKELSMINEDIKDEENQLQKLNSFYKQIPENVISNNSKKIEESQNNLDSLINTFDILSKIDKINDTSDVIQKLFLLKSLLLSNKISNKMLKELIVNKLINNDIIKSIEQSLLNINYPMFKGKMLMTTYEQLNTENKNDLEILSLYFEIYSYMANDLYIEFANYGTLNKLILKNNEKNDNHFYFIEMISEYLFKKILATIFYERNNSGDVIQSAQDIPGYQKKLSFNERNILYKYEKLISYLNKCISNTSELFSILMNKAKEDNENNENKKSNNNKEYQFNRNITMKFIISSLLEKIILFLTSEETPLDLSNCTTLLMILLIQKTSEHSNELIKNYQYDSLKNISLYDFLKYFLNDNQTELKKRQKEFNENMLLKLKETIIKELKSKTYKSEDLLDNIIMIIKDVLSIYETFRTYTILEDLLMSSCEEIYSEFEKYYNEEKDSEFNGKGLSLGDNLFLINLLYNYFNICSNEFDLFLERIKLFGESTIKKICDTLKIFKNKVNILYKDYINEIIPKIEFNKIVDLYNYANLKKGNKIEDINAAFDEENDFWYKIKLILRKIKADIKINKYIETHVVEFFIDCLTKKVKKNLEKSDIEGNNLEHLIDKTKFFIEDNFINDDNEISNENKENIQKLYSYLDNLFMNKK